MDLITGRYTFKHTSLETAMDNPKFIVVFKSLESTGAGVELQYEELNGDLIMTFQKEPGCIERKPSKPKVHIPAPPTAERCQKELDEAIKRKKALYQPRFTDTPDNWGGDSRRAAHALRRKARYVGWWLSMNCKLVAERRVKLDYSMLEKVGIHYTKAKYPCKNRQTFVEYLRSCVSRKAYYPLMHDPLATPQNVVGAAEAKADIAYWKEMLRLAEAAESRKHAIAA